jgi:protein-disulfide isomerase
MKHSLRTTQFGQAKWALVAGLVFLLVFSILALTLVKQEESAPATQSVVDEIRAALASEHSPTLGDPDAPVHIVEFLDPACETCAVFYPMVKQWLTEVPDKLRLSVRHVAFHKGSEHAVRILEASRAQDKYWETLEALLATQQQWTQNHTVLPERIIPAIADVGLDMDMLETHLNSMNVMRRMEQDRNDAVLLRVRATPEYYVNGRPLPSFGRQQLMDLVREELEKAERN